MRQQGPLGSCVTAGLIENDVPGPCFMYDSITLGYLKHLEYLVQVRDTVFCFYASKEALPDESICDEENPARGHFLA